MNNEYGTFINKGYVRELRATGNRKKSRAFIEYQIDMEEGELNAGRFYAKSWEVSLSTSQKWAKEFSVKIALFHDYWHLKNTLQYNHVKNCIGRSSVTSRSEIQSIQPNNTDFEISRKSGIGRSSVKERISILSSKGDFSTDGMFNIFYSECRLINGKYVGSKDEVYPYYKYLSEFVETNIILKAYRSYIKDSEDNKSVGVAKFINDEFYLPYLPARVSVKSSDGNEYSGTYKKDKELLELDNGKKVNFTNSMYVKKLFNREIEFIGAIA